MSHDLSEPGSELDAEGIPDHLGALPSKDAVAHDVGVDRGGFSAEESAMHVETE